MSRHPETSARVRDRLHGLVEEHGRNRRVKEVELEAVLSALEDVAAARRRQQQPTQSTAPRALNDRRPLGNLLVARGYIHDRELQLALARQADTPGRRLGEILIDMGLITDRDLAEVLSEQMRLPMIALARVRCDETVIDMISCHDARRLGATPVRRNDDGAIVLAIADPTDDAAVDTLGLLLRAPMELYVASRSEILAVIDRRANTTTDY